MNFEHLRLLRRLLQSPNLSQIAEERGMSQSNLSKILRQIEGELGFEVFERRGYRGLEATNRAKALIPRLELLERSWRESMDLFRMEPKDRLDVKVSGPALYMRYRFLPAWFAAGLHEKFRLSYVQTRIENISLLDQTGDFDLLISSEKVAFKDWIATSLDKENFSLFVNSKNSRLNLEGTDWTKFRYVGYRSFDDLTLNFMRRRNVPEEKIIAFLDDSESIAETLTKLEQSAAVLPSHVPVPKGLQRVQLSELGSRDLSMIYRKGSSLSSADRQTLKSRLAEHQKT